MKIFMSWSGQRSHAAAEVISWWVSCVIQASRPWISSVDVDRGSLWFSEISNVLAEVQAGIVCLTHENKTRPWILFEAGALAKGLSTSRVCTFLVDLEPNDIKDPLAQFNHTKPDKEGMRKLARTLNGVLGANALDPNVLNSACDTYWPQFEAKYAAAMEAHPLAGPVEVRSNDDVLGEILNSVRGLNQRIRSLENEGMPMWDLPGIAEVDGDVLVEALKTYVVGELSKGRSATELHAEITGNESYTNYVKLILTDFFEGFYKGNLTSTPLRNLRIHRPKSNPPKG